MKYFLSFTEEFWPGQKPNTFIGRVEIYIDNDNPYADDEIPIRAKNREEVIKIRDEYDFKDVDKKTLNKLKKIIKKLNENIK